MNNEDFYKNLGIKIKEFREQRGLTQQQLAEKTGISLNFEGKIEISMNKPSLDTLVKIARALEVEPYMLLKFD